jgi:NAD(P)H-nitrite reductase large subunit
MKIILEKNKINLVQVSYYCSSIKILLDNNAKIAYDKLVLATGSKPNKYGWPGQDLQGVTGLYHKQDLEALERWAPTTKRAVIVGGGLIGIELAEMLRSRNIPVTLFGKKKFWDGVLPFEMIMIIFWNIILI